MLWEGRQNGRGYAPSSADTHLAAVVIGLRERGIGVSGDDQAAARKALAGLEVKLLQAGERRGRGQAVGADIDGLYAIARSCSDTLAGDLDKALVLTGFHYALRSQDPVGLQCGDITLPVRGLVVAVSTGKTKHCVRNAKIGYAQDPENLPSPRVHRLSRAPGHRARTAVGQPVHPGLLRYRPARPRHRRPGPRQRHPRRQADLRPRRGADRLDRALPAHRAGPATPAPCSATWISARAGVPIAWIGHFLRIGLASVARRRGRDGIAIADQGGCARHRSMLGYMQRDDGSDDNASAGLA
ncbi:integrase [Streptomyces sp. 2P-4]|uniref:integrase n=1 Tax=Streptomyces sp. 2P-4 TaxID=2931974 RepID=UPI00254142C3|nr:integrase [Streptomyces sp. 2P-4]